MDESKLERRSVKRTARGVFEKEPGSGVWWVRYADENGRLHREKVGPKGLARKVYEKRKTEVQERRFFPERIRRRETMLADFIDDYLSRVKGKLRSYRDYVRNGSVWKAVFKGKTLRQILPGDIDRYVAQRIDRVSVASVNRELAFLKRVLNVAMADGLTDSNPVRAIRMFKENNARVRFLSDEEDARLREVMEEEDWSIVLVAINTGLRQSEQFNLRWENVDFATGILTVPRSKHGESRRVPMNDTVREVLRTLPSRLKSEYVFPSTTGETPIDARNYVRRTFLPALKKAGVEDLHWHDLRHTFASRLAMAGVDLPTLQALMGHKSISMTLRYSHLSPKHQLAAVQRLIPEPTSTSTGTDSRESEQRPPRVQKTRNVTAGIGATTSDSNRRPADYESADYCETRS